MGTDTNAHRQSQNEVSDALRALAANLIAIVGGAGKPLEFGLQVEAFTAALSDFRSVTGKHATPRELAEILRIDLDPRGPAPLNEEEMAELYAQLAVIHTSLQHASARLLGHEEQAANAYADLHRALIGLEETKRKIAKRRDDADTHILAQMKSPKPGGHPS